MKKTKTMRNWTTAGLLVGLLLISLVVAARPAKSQSAVQGLRICVLDGGSIKIDAPEKFGLTRE